MKVFAYLPLVFLTGLLHAQKVIDVEKDNLPNTASMFYAVGGTPLSNYKYVKIVEGTPYFNEIWMMGKLTLRGGTIYDSMLLRLDLMENSLQYIDKEGNEMITTSPVKSILLNDIINRTQYHFDHSQFIQSLYEIKPGWYQVLDTGKAILYKNFNKSIDETKPYGSATFEQRIVTRVSYYIMQDAQLVPIKKFKEIPTMVKEKGEELKTYINNKNLTGKKEADYIDLLHYYNSLF